MKYRNYHNITKIVFFVFAIFSYPALPQDSTKSVEDSLHNISQTSVSEFQQQLNDIFNDQSFRNANWGVVIQSLETGEYLYKRNEDKFFIPASNLKLFTTASGLLLLGPNYKFSTKFWTNGYHSGSTLYGDLIIQGRGDPTISGRFYNNDNNFVFDSWTDSLIELGIDKIKGNIIGDDNLFDDLGLGEGWSWDSETDWYAAQSSAISFNDNCIDIIIYYDKKADSIIVKTKPELKNIIILNNLKTANHGEQTSVNVYRERGTNVVTVFGTVKRSVDTLITYSTVRNPTQFTLLAFKNRLESKGIRVNGYAIDIDDYDRNLDYDKMTLLFTGYSNELSEIIKVINKNSQNFFAEQLLKTIGLEINGFGSAEKGISAIKELSTEIGINPDNLVMVDGSGLSHLDMVTPRQIVELLKYMYSNKELFPYFFNSFPIAGVDGSLGKRMKGTSAENIVRAKTGYISHVRSLSGYAVTGDNEPVAFSMIANNFNVPVKLAENLQDLVCLRITNFRRKQ
jgi:D-alanyl-D-alanine carboxypeptidase/D-alanyl-D-alanine-endopeptidase (penicillin-binding protein 4)